MTDERGKFGQFKRILPETHLEIGKNAIQGACLGRIDRRANQARASVFKYIETFYNSKRIHQSLKHLTPDQFEQEHGLSTGQSR